MLKVTDTHPYWRDKRMFSRINTIVEINVIRLALRCPPYQERHSN